MAEAVGYPLKTFTKALEALRKPLGFFLYLLEALRKAIGNICPKVLEVLEKAVGFFPLLVEGLKKSRWKKKLVCSEPLGAVEKAVLAARNAHKNHFLTCQYSIR